MVLEPNCSIIAACLPCYGTLFAKGQSLGSIIKSARSMFSLRSQGSSSRSRGGDSLTRGRGTKPTPEESGSESQVELTAPPDGWPRPSTGGRATVKTNKAHVYDVERAGAESPGIVVNTRLDVERN